MDAHDRGATRPLFMCSLSRVAPHALWQSPKFRLWWNMGQMRACLDCTAVWLYCVSSSGLM